MQNQLVIIVNDILGEAKSLKKEIEKSGYAASVVEKKAGKTFVDSAIETVEAKLLPGSRQGGIVVLDLDFEGEGTYAGRKVLCWMRQNDRRQPVLLATGHTNFSGALPQELGYCRFPKSGNINEIKYELENAQSLSDEEIAQAREVLPGVDLEEKIDATTLIREFQHDLKNLTKTRFFKKFIRYPSEPSLNKVREKVCQLKQEFPELEALLSRLENIEKLLSDFESEESLSLVQDAIRTMRNTIKDIKKGLAGFEQSTSFLLFQTHANQILCGLDKVKKVFD